MSTNTHRVPVECNICLEKVTQTTTLICNHTSCSCCIQKWYEKKLKCICPYCRNEDVEYGISLSKTFRNRVIRLAVLFMMLRPVSIIIIQFLNSILVIDIIVSGIGYFAGIDSNNNMYSLFPRYENATIHLPQVDVVLLYILFSGYMSGFVFALVSLIVPS